MLKNSYVKLVSIIHAMVAHASVTSSKPKVDMCKFMKSVQSFMSTLDQLTSTVMIKKMAREVPKQLIPL